MQDINFAFYFKDKGCFRPTYLKHLDPDVNKGGSLQERKHKDNTWFGNRNINYQSQRHHGKLILPTTQPTRGFEGFHEGNFFKVKTQVLAQILIKIWFWKWKYELWISKTRPGPRWVASSKVVPQTTNLSYWHTWDNQSPRWVSFHINSFSVNILCLWTASNLNV